MTILGEKKQIEGWTCRGWMSHERMSEIVDFLIRSIGMEPGRECRIDHYPYKGKGGAGYTLYQPLTDSWAVADIYTDLNQTKFTLASCKPFQNEIVCDLLEVLIGPVIRILSRDGFL